LILEGDRAQLRDMTRGEQRSVATDNVIAEMTGGEA
jgi:hypothetical protein